MTKLLSLLLVAFAAASLQAQPAWVQIQRCPETVHGLAQFPDTLPGPGGLAEVAGTCLPHAHISPGSSGAPRMHCSPDGEWLVPVGRCHCEPGFEEGGSDVEECLGKKT